EDKRQTLVLQEVRDFWSRKEAYNKLGFSHKRGILLEGPPGSGKSCILKMVMEDIIAEGDIVLKGRSANTLNAGLKAFRQIEPDRKVVVIMEDVDEMVAYGEHTLLQMFDGDDQQ